MTLGIFGTRQIVLTQKGSGNPKPLAKKHKKNKKVAKKIKGILNKLMVKPKKRAKKGVRTMIKKKKSKPKVKKSKAKKLKAKKEVKPKVKKEVKIGEVTHFYPHVNAAVIKLKAPLSQGDKVHIKGHTTDLTEKITSMQINNKPIKKGKKGDEIGLLVKEKVRGGDIAYKEK